MAIRIIKRNGLTELSANPYKHSMKYRLFEYLSHRLTTPRLWHLMSEDLSDSSSCIILHHILLELAELLHILTGNDERSIHLHERSLTMAVTVSTVV